MTVDKKWKQKQKPACCHHIKKYLERFAPLVFFITHVFVKSATLCEGEEKLLAGVNHMFHFVVIM